MSHPEDFCVAYNFDASKNRLNLLAIKMQGTNRSGEGGRRACYVTPDGSELRLGGREKNEGEDHEWDGGKK